MTDYLIKLYPLEPFFFGGEQNFDFGNVSRAVKQSYFISSLNRPSQTTLMGALRYAVLSSQDALVSDYTSEEQKALCNELVGEKSFSFDEYRDFGKIGSISPLFIFDNGVYYVPTPANHYRGSSRYSPLKIKSDEDISFSCGNSLFVENYLSKEGCGGGWVSLDGDLDVIADDEMFECVVRVGVNAGRTGGKITDKESYYKKQFKRLCKECFAFFASMDSAVAEPLLNGVVVYLGQNKSAFKLIAEKSENDLIEKVKSAFSGMAETTFLYALGDCRVDETISGFHIAKTHLFRHLETTADARYYYRLKKTEKLYRLIDAGAVFYSYDENFGENKICEKIGLNMFVEIGGK